MATHIAPFCNSMCWNSQDSVSQLCMEICSHACNMCVISDGCCTLTESVYGLCYLSKAFDTVQRDLLWDILRRFGCPNKFVNILRQFHDGMNARMTIGGQEAVSFPVCTGVRQGRVLAPVLFNIFLICVTQLLHKEIEDNSGVSVVYSLDGSLFNSRRLQATTELHRVRILELQYADDCALVAHTPENLQTVLNTAVKA